MDSDTVTPGRVVAITGASGFVGKWLLRHFQDHLAGQGVEARSFFQDISATESGDIRDAALVSRVMRDLRPYAVVHLAAVSDTTQARNDLRQAFDVNLYGTLNLAEAIRVESPETRLVFVGSSEAYGQSFNKVDVPLTEEASLIPATAYGVTKAAADLMLGQMAQQGLQVVRFRPFNHTGPGQSEAFVVPAFAKQIVRIERGLQPPVIDVGNLTAMRDFLDVRDVVRAYAKAVLADFDLHRSGVAINVSSGQPVAISRLIDLLISMSHVTVDVRIDPLRTRPSEIVRASGDPSRAQSLLGWTPRISLEQTLSDVLTFWRAQSQLN